MHSILPAVANPAAPEEIEVSQPSDALDARAAVLIDAIWGLYPALRAARMSLTEALRTA